MTAVILFVLGAIVGSFLNVVALRWDNKNFGGRSLCPDCLKTLRWFELVPIFSFFVQGGKCRHCRSKISYQYPITEILTGLIFATVPLSTLPVWCLYIVIVIYDIRHKVIPDELVYAAIFLSFLVPLFVVHYSWLDWLSGPILFILFGSIWFLSRGRALGFGDAKLVLSVGLLLGASTGFSAIVLAFWIGALGSLVYILLVKMGFLKNAEELTMKSEMPFAPFIVAGAWLSLVFRLNLLHVVSF